ncbi:hypothetical protein Aperf_G00000117780 [Anoplocephala perfoliata]
MMPSCNCFLKKRHRVEAIQAEEPAFIKRFREQSGMKPEATIESKVRLRRHLANDDDFRDREDEAPQIVAGIGVSEEEASEFVQRNLAKRTTEKEGNGSEEDADKPTPKEIEAEKSNKILFRKPKSKRFNDSDNKNEKKDSGYGKMERLKDRRRKEENLGGTLSFSYDEEEEDV